MTSPGAPDEPPAPAKPPPPAGSLLRPLGEAGPPPKPDRTGFLYVVFIALVLIGFVALALSFL